MTAAGIEAMQIIDTDIKWFRRFLRFLGVDIFDQNKKITCSTILSLIIISSFYVIFIYNCYLDRHDFILIAKIAVILGVAMQVMFCTFVIYSNYVLDDINSITVDP